MLKRLPPFFKSFYFLATVFFLVWMIFLDQNDFISGLRLSGKLRSLEKEKVYYEEKIEQVKQDHNELFGDKESLEKFAREKYLMKKPTEEIFIVVKE
jgi:cell division protein DivIC